MSRKWKIIVSIFVLLFIGVLSIHLFSRLPLFHVPFREAHPEHEIFSVVILSWPKWGHVDSEGNYAFFDIERNLTVVVITGQLERHADDIAAGATGSRSGSAGKYVDGKLLDIYVAEPSDATHNKAILFQGTRYEYEVDARPNRLVLAGIDVGMEVHIPVGQTERWERAAWRSGNSSFLDIFVETHVGPNRDRFQDIVTEGAGIITKAGRTYP